MLFSFCFVDPDDFESKYLFHPLDDFPPPDEYRHFAKIYPSKAYSGLKANDANHKRLTYQLNNVDGVC